MICPHIVNVSMMLGSILTWGILWPYIDGKAGEWYPVGLREHDFKGLFGYKVIVYEIMPAYASNGSCKEYTLKVHDVQVAVCCVNMYLCTLPGRIPVCSKAADSACCEQVFLAIAVFLGDGLYHFTKISIISLWAIKDGIGGKSKNVPVAATPTSPATPEKVVLTLPPHTHALPLLPSLSMKTHGAGSQALVINMLPQRRPVHEHNSWLATMLQRPAVWATRAEQQCALQAPHQGAPCVAHQATQLLVCMRAASSGGGASPGWRGRSPAGVGRACFGCRRSCSSSQPQAG